MTAPALTLAPRVTIAAPRGTVQIRAPRGDVSIRSGSARVTLSAPGQVVVAGRSARVEMAAAARVVVVGSRQGVAGPPGPGAEIEVYLSAVDLGGHRAVALDAAGALVYASAALGRPAIGIIRDAVPSAAEVAVYRAGRVGGFTGLTPAATYYLGANGSVTLTAPVGGVLQPLGVAASATELLVDPDYPTFL